MSTEKDLTTKIKPTGRRYPSVSALMQKEGVSGEVQGLVAELEKETRVTRQLASMRAAAGITQEQMAGRLGCTQGCISKWESGRDEDLTFKIVRDYAKETNQGIGLTFGKPLSHAQAVKAHAFCIRDHLLELAKIAYCDEEIEREIQAFFGEAAFNLMDIVGRCQQQMPNGGEVEVRVQVMRQSVPKRGISRRVREMIAEPISA